LGTVCFLLVEPGPPTATGFVLRGVLLPVLSRLFFVFRPSDPCSTANDQGAQPHHCSATHPHTFPLSFPLKTFYRLGRAYPPPVSVSRAPISCAVSVLSVTFFDPYPPPPLRNRVDILDAPQDWTRHSRRKRSPSRF